MARANRTLEDRARFGLGYDTQDDETDPSDTQTQLTAEGVTAVASIPTAALEDDAVTNAKIADNAVDNLQMTTNAKRRISRTVWFNLDNGAAATIDDVIMKVSVAMTVIAARIVYVDATTGTVAAGNARIGTTLGGSEVVAATAYGDAVAVGTQTAMTIVSGVIAAGGAVFVRHTGVAATQAGQAFVEIEYRPT